MIEDKGYGILEFENIWSMARDLVYDVLCHGMMLDEEGNYVGNVWEPEEWMKTCLQRKLKKSTCLSQFLL